MRLKDDGERTYTYLVTHTKSGREDITGKLAEIQELGLAGSGAGGGIRTHDGPAPTGS